MTKNIFSKITAMMLILLMVGNLSFGMVAITDVTSSHWAYNYVQRVVENEIMILNEDDSFKPNENVTNVEAIVVLYRAAKAAGYLKDVNLNTLTGKYESDLEAINLPKMLAPYGGDVYPALSYALENKVLTLDEVKYFVSNGKLTEAKKVDISVFFGKALNVYKNENLNKIISLSYKDAFDISLGALKYVNLLIEYDIISNKGDSNGNFNPKSIINKSVLAVYADGYFTAIKSDTTPVPSTSGDTTGTNSGTETTIPSSSDTNAGTQDHSDAVKVTGTITDVFSDLKLIEVKEAVGKTTVYDLKQAKIYADQAMINFDSLEKGAFVNLSLTNGVVTTVVLDKTYDKVEGTFSQVTEPMGESIKFRSLKIQLPNKSFDFKRVYDTTPITIDGVQKTVLDLKEGYKLIVSYDGYDAKGITAYSDYYQFTGMLKQPLDPASPTTLEMEKEDGLVFKQELTKSVTFTNSEKVLSKNDIVKVTLNYGVVSNISYVGQAKDLVGTIEEIHITRTPEIAIKLEDNKIEKYAVSKTAKIVDEIGNESLSIYDLKLDQTVRVHVGAEGIDRIDFSYEKEVIGFSGTVTNVFVTTNLLVVKSDDGVTKTVGFAPASGLKITDYVIGDKLFIKGKKLSEVIFEADAITITKN
ncbi:S-layer homology domain-containing protein [Fusibacter ferrireducens]|uniref:S-layer homology domain-containing protein n=1 Tax=Fusibacter ferrireducens TaxID=2785058 RepID=A0ABR9ZXI4_9FIRM|nr:S-layer homology domain-containing protein [Fusibacter ferrireducens]MBF4694575.1 S-layer homology domain-containing protein [Fusibacter ferrireducens]